MLYQLVRGVTLPRSNEHGVCLCDLIVRPSHSIIKQSFDCRERLVAGAVPVCKILHSRIQACNDLIYKPQLNGDGFGIGWYSFDDSSSDRLCSTSKRRKLNDSLTASVENSLSAVNHDPEQLFYRRKHTPGVFTSVTPAWNNANLYRLSEKIQ